MCGRFTIGAPQKIQKRFNTMNKLPLFEASWNVAPQQDIPTITRNSPNKIVIMNWGLVFSQNVKYGTINLRAESFKEKPFFQHFLKSNRCLIVADSFYEWGMVNLEGKEEKYPFNFFLKDRELFGFAGVYNDIGGKLTCTIITCQPNKKVANVHNRMPVILQKKDEDTWLDPENNDFESLFKLLAPYPEDQMSMNIVSKMVNSPGINSPKLIEKFKPKKFGYGLLD